MADAATASATQRHPSAVEPTIVLSATVVKGFGRGSKDLGIPTANLAADAVRAAIADVPAGIYFGWAALGGVAYKACVSVGWNPHFPGELREKTVEPHLLHAFENDFYGRRLDLALCGRIAGAARRGRASRTSASSSRGVGPPMASRGSSARRAAAAPTTE